MYLLFRYPEKVLVPNGGAFVFQRDPSSGGLKSLTTPRGHAHGFSSRNMPGYKSITCLPPWSRYVFIIPNFLVVHLMR